MTSAGPRQARCYRALLWFYPSQYRARFAGDMVDTFACDYARVSRRGFWTVCAFWIVTVAQAVWFGAAERSSTGVPMSPRSPRFSFVPDVRHAVRLLRRSPLFAVTSIVSLALGLAATTVIFSLTDALVFQSAPGVRDADRVVDIGRTVDGTGFDNMSYPTFLYLRDHTQTLEGMSATTFDGTPVSLSTGDGSERVFGQLVSASYFDVLKVKPALGRFFRADEDLVANDRPVVVLTHHLWQTRFDGDRSIVGRTIRINNHDFAVVGVAEEGFTGATMMGTDLWMPSVMVGVARGGDGAAQLRSVRSVWHTAIGRLKPGVSLEQAQAELQTLMTAFKADNPEMPERYGIGVTTSGRLPGEVRTPFTVFFGVLFALTFGLLAIACSNVAGMLLARATARQREMATRLAIGASRGQLIVQLVTETLVLFLVAAIIALPVAAWLSAVLQSFLPALPVQISVDWSVGGRAIVFALGLALLSGLVFGLAPARQALRSDLSAALHGHASTASRSRLRTRHALVVAQVALSLTMVVTAGLFMRTLMSAASISPGFRIEGVDMILVDTSLVGAEGQAAVGLVDRVTDALKAIPGVDHVGHSRVVPLQGSRMGLGGVRVPGLDADALYRLNDAGWDTVSADYFATLDLPIVQGRPFATTDRDGQPLVAIVNETFARLAWPGQNAVGQRFWQTDGPDDDGRPLEVVGVARDAKYRTISEEPQPFIYVPFAQQPDTAVTLYVTTVGGADVGAAVRQTIARVERGLPVILYQPLADATMLGLLPQRLAAWIAGSVGIIGLFLAALGLYGLTAFLVAQRTREIAIRMALGATHADVQGMVLGRAGRLGVIGAVVGVLLAVGLGQVVQSLSLLVNVTATDPFTYGAVVGLMGAVLLIASVVPARRASRTDPAVALRTE